MFTMDPYFNFRCRFMLKYMTLIAFVITTFGLLYMISKDDITRKSKSSRKHPSVHIWHPKAGSKLSNLLRLREQLGASAYRSHMKGVPSGMKFYFENDHPMVRFLLKRFPHYVTLENAPKPTIVLPLSSRRYEEGLDTIESVQRHLPKEKMMVYDLGLTRKQKATLIRLCNVKVIDFPFKKFPPYVRLLMKFHWKPLLLQLALNEYGSVLWVESSTRLTTGDLSHAIKEAKETGIKIFGTQHVYSTYSVTHPGMLRYIPTNLRRLKVSGQTQTAPMIIYHTRDIERKLTKWLVLCGLERFCLAPLLARRQCNGLKTNKASKDARYLNCHRFDQSAINILLKNMFNYDTSKFMSKHRFSVLKRGRAKHSANLKYCIGKAKTSPHHDKILAVKKHLAAGMRKAGLHKPKARAIPKVQGQIRGQGKNAQVPAPPAKKSTNDPSVKAFLKQKAEKAAGKPAAGGGPKPAGMRNRREVLTVPQQKSGSGNKKPPPLTFKRPKARVQGFHEKVQARLRQIRRMRRRRAYEAYLRHRNEQLRLKQQHQLELQRQQQQQQQQQQLHKPQNQQEHLFQGLHQPQQQQHDQFHVVQQPQHQQQHDQLHPVQ